MRDLFIVAALAFVLGAGVCYKALQKDPAPVVAKNTDTKTLIKKKVTKNPDGSVTTETDTSIDERSSVNVGAQKKADNILLTATNDLTVGALVRPLEHLWVGAEHNLKNHETTYKVGYSVRIF